MARRIGKTTTLILCALLCLLLLPGGSALASSLGVTPSHVSADDPLTPGLRYTLPEYTVQNTTTRQLTVDMSVSDHRDAERLLPPPGWFSFSVDRLTIPAESERTVKVELSVPKDATEGSYRVWLRFTAVAVGGGMSFLPAIQVPVTFDVGEATVAPVTEFTLNIGVTGQGTTTPIPGKYVEKSGTTVSLRAVADEGWEFSHWQGPVASRNSANTTVKVEADVTVTAAFTEVKTPEPAEPTEPDEPAKLLELLLSAELLELELNASEELLLSALFDDETEQDVTQQAAWTSSDAAIAEVDSGVVIAKAAGEVTITAEYEGLLAEVRLTVTAPPEPAPNEPDETSQQNPGGPPWMMIGLGVAVLGLGGWLVSRKS